MRRLQNPLDLTLASRLRFHTAGQKIYNEGLLLEDCSDIHVIQILRVSKQFGICFMH